MGIARELAERTWSAVESGSIERLAGLFAEDCDFSTSMGGGRGPAYVIELFTRHRQGYPDLSHEVEECIESADGTAAALRIAFRAHHLAELRGPLGTIAPTGQPLRWRSSDHVRVRDGLIVSWHAHFDRLALLDQLGQLDRLRTPVQPGQLSPRKAALRRVLDEVFGKGELAVLDEVLTPDFVNHRTPPGVTNDAAGLRQIVRMERAGFPDLSYTVEWEAEEGDLVIQVAMADGTHLGKMFGVAPTGRRVQWRQVHIVRMDGDRMAEHWGVSDLAGLWVQIGKVSPIERVPVGT